MDKPTHEQAKLQLEIYDLRREPRMRQAVSGSSKTIIPPAWKMACASRRWAAIRAPW